MKEESRRLAQHSAQRACAFQMHVMKGSAIAPPLHVEGYLAVEVFSGVEAVTLGCELHGVPCVMPWAICDGPQLDVVRNSDVLIRLAEARRVRASWIASPCQALTLARSPALKSVLFPYGLPNLNERENALVEAGNRLADFAVKLCLALCMALSYFALENLWTN